jgi:hypothetical protein
MVGRGVVRLRRSEMRCSLRVEGAVGEEEGEEVREGDCDCVSFLGALRL